LFISPTPVILPHWAVISCLLGCGIRGIHGMGIGRRSCGVLLAVACERVPLPGRQATDGAGSVCGVFLGGHGVSEALFADGADGSAHVFGGFCVDAFWWVEVVVCWPDLCAGSVGHKAGVMASIEAHAASLLSAR